MALRIHIPATPWVPSNLRAEAVSLPSLYTLQFLLSKASSLVILYHILHLLILSTHRHPQYYLCLFILFCVPYWAYVSTKQAETLSILYIAVSPAPQEGLAFSKYLKEGGLVEQRWSIFHQLDVPQHMCIYMQTDSRKPPDTSLN